MAVPAVLLVSLVLPGAVSEAADAPARLDSLTFTAGDLPRLDGTSAGDSPRLEWHATPIRREVVPTPSRGFVNAYLLPRLSRQFDAMAPRHSALDSVPERVDHLLYDSLNHSARRRVESSAKRAVRSYLLETTPLGRLFGSGKRDAPSSGGVAAVDERPAPAPKPRPSTRFGLGVSHGLPQVELRYGAAARSVRFRLRANGTAGLSFSHSKMTDTQLALRYDFHDQEYGVHLRFSF